MHSCKIEIMMTTAVNDNYQLKQLIKEQSEKKNQALIELQTPDLYDTGPALLPTELSSQLGAGYL